jgi:hypothetical protein
MVTLVTSAAATVPEPPPTAHVWTGLPGGVETVTAYVAPLAIFTGNVKLPFAVTTRGVPALSERET